MNATKASTQAHQETTKRTCRLIKKEKGLGIITKKNSIRIEKNIVKKIIWGLTRT